MRLGVSPALALLTISVTSIVSAQEGSTPPKAPAAEGAKPAAPPAAPKVADAPEAEEPDDATPTTTPETEDSEAKDEVPSDEDEAEPDSAESEAADSKGPAKKKSKKKARPATKAEDEGDDEEETDEDVDAAPNEDEDEDEDEHEHEHEDVDEPEEAKPATVAPDARSLRTGFLIAPRLGLIFGGATHLDLECEETGDLGCGTFGARDHDEASGFALALDALYGIIPELRAGLSLHYLPQVKGDAGGELRRLGTGFDFQGVAEGVFDLTDRFAITLRIQGGGTALIPSGFVDEVVDGARDDCETVRDAGVDCTVKDGPYFAPTLGGGAGVLIQTKGPARLRLDFLFQAHRMKLYEQKAATDGGTVDATVSMDQSRLWLLGGFEL